jgi:FtsH-binding integral membrane protein
VSNNSKALVENNSSVKAEQQRFMVRVYNWMAAGLAITGIVAFATASSVTMSGAVSALWFFLVIIELGLVFWLAGFIQRMSTQVAQIVFLSYAVLNGLTISSIFLTYSLSSISSTFFITAGTFGAMSYYGYTTKKDLTSWGSFFFMGLIGIIIASIVNIFMQNSMLNFVISCIGVFVFVGLTAYDTQKIKTMNILGNEMTDEDTKEAISGALMLYLDFINFFLDLLRILGRIK